MNKIKIPKEVIDNVIEHLSELDPTPWDEEFTASSVYAECEWYIECRLKYDLHWHEDTDGAGQNYDYYETVPTEIIIDKCRYYPEPDAEPDHYVDCSDELYDELYKEIQPDL